MTFRKAAMAAVAAASLVAVPTMAAAQSAAKLSVRSAPAVSGARVGAETDSESKLAGGSVIIAILAAAAIIAGIVIAVDGDDDPVSS